MGSDVTPALFGGLKSLRYGLPEIKSIHEALRSWWRHKLLSIPLYIGFLLSPHGLQPTAFLSPGELSCVSSLSPSCGKTIVHLSSILQG